MRLTELLAVIVSDGAEGNTVVQAEEETTCADKPLQRVKISANAKKKRGYLELKKMILRNQFPKSRNLLGWKG